MTAGFDRTARVVSGTTPRDAAARPYRVSVGSGRLRLALVDTGHAVLDVPLAQVSTRPIGRAGAASLEVGGTPLLVDFTDRAHGAGALAAVRRIAHGLAGRRVRRAFLTAAGPT